MPLNWIFNIEFAYPWVFAGFLLIPLVIMRHIKFVHKQRAALLVSTTHLLKKTRSWRIAFMPALAVMRYLALTLLIVAMARPQLKVKKAFIEGNGIDIMICIDVSGSMKTEDISPIRLQAAVEVAREFARSRMGDQMGLVVFSNNSLTLCPLTIDTNAVISQINSLVKPPLSESGTVIGSGIAACINGLKTSSTKTKTIILITDGVDSEDAISPLEAAAAAKAADIKIYTIGIGINNGLTRRTILNTDNGPPIVIESDEKLNEPLLKKLAAQTGGKYFNAANKQSLSMAFNAFNRLEKSKIKNGVSINVIDKYRPFLLLALICLFMEMLFRYSLFRVFP